MIITELKSNSLKVLKGNWLKVGIVTFVYIAILVALSYFLDSKNIYITLIRLLMLEGLSLGYLYFCLNVKKNIHSPFDIFKKYDLLYKAIILAIPMNLSSISSYLYNNVFNASKEIYILIPYLLISLFGVFLGLRLVLSRIILINNPKMHIIEIIKTSNKFMIGNVFNYIRMMFSFFPLILLSALTLGIGFIFLIPYIVLVEINFHDHICCEG